MKASLPVLASTGQRNESVTSKGADLHLISIMDKTVPILVSAEWINPFPVAVLCEPIVVKGRWQCGLILKDKTFF